MQAQTVPSEETPPARPSRPAAQVRADLAFRLVDVLSLPAGQVSDNERSFTAEILNQLFDHLELETRADISERLSTVLAPPAVLLRRMLLEPIEVAKPLFENLKTIPDSMLAEAAGAGPAHRSCIIRRFGMSEFVTDAVLATGDVEAAQFLLRRIDIEVSERRLDDLVALTEENTALRDPLLGRVELQPRHGFQMFWWLSSEDRKRVLSRFATDRTVIQDVLKNLYREVFPDPDPDPVAKNILRLCDRRHRARGRNGETLGLDVVKRTLTTAIANPSSDLCMATAFIAGVSPETAKMVLLDPGGEPFAILTKAVGIGRADFIAILAKAQLVREADSRGPEIDDAKADYLLAIFDMTARDYSRTILRYWDWKRAQPGISVPQ